MASHSSRLIMAFQYRNENERYGGRCHDSDDEVIVDGHGSSAIS
jgi:hypothetical protein